MTRRTFVALPAALAASAPRSKMGIATTSYMTVARPKDTLAFFDHCRELGAGGIQSSLASTESEYLDTLRRRAEEAGMYLEVMIGLPRQDTVAFERIVEGAKRVGALCVRANCGGRRYEDFSNLDDRRRFERDSKAAIARALPIVEKHNMRLAVENHKDWTLDEQLALFREFSNERLGVCLDTGNNMSLLDDPMEVVEKLAPYAFSTHIKDMAVDEYADGFLLSEVPLGEGMLDMKRIVETIRRARPEARMSLEMITRNPLQIPCLTDKYWITLSGQGPVKLARMLAMVRKHKQQLPRLDGLNRADQLRLEEDNVKRSLNYGREQLGL